MQKEKVEDIDLPSYLTSHRPLHALTNHSLKIVENSVTNAVAVARLMAGTSKQRIHVIKLVNWQYIFGIVNWVRSPCCRVYRLIFLTIHDRDNVYGRSLRCGIFCLAE